MNKITLFFSIACVLFFSFSFGQRNNCDDNAAGEIIVGSTCVTQPLNSSNNSDYWNGAAADGSCSAADLDDVWMWFVATSTSTTITYTPDIRDAILHLFEGNCNTGMTSVACSDNIGNGVAETIVYATTPGTTYRIRVQRWNSNNNMTGNICVWSPVPSCHPLTYCPNAYGSAVEAITNVNFAGINNTTAPGTAGGAQEILCDTANVLQGSTYPISINGDTEGNFVNYMTAFFDWNQDGDFEDADERYDIGTINNNVDGTGAPATNTIAVPASATLGITSMRIIKNYNAYATNSCTPGSGYGQTEDYLVNVSSAGPCTTPTAQATGLSLSVSGTTVGGSFTAATPAPDSYLVVVNTTGVTPIPVDGVSYNIGDTIAGGNTVIDTDTNTSFSTNLTASTTYYFFVFSFNGFCTGGPLYYNTSPLNGTATTGAVSYCTPSTLNDPTPRYIDDVEFIGTLNDVSNFGNGAATGPAGYQNFTGLPNASQQQGEGMNVYVAGDSRGHIKAWVDWNQDGVFDNTTETVYDSGVIGTTSTTFGYSIPLTQPIGTYTLRIRFYNSYGGGWPTWHPSYESYVYDFDACETFDTNAGYTEYGEAEDYTFDVVARCDAQITSIGNGESCGTLEPVELNVTGAANVTSYNWYANETGGTPLATTTTGTWTTPPISGTTVYWVAGDNGTCEAYERERVIAFLNAPATLTFTPSVPTICGENSPPIQITAASTTQIAYLIDEEFDSGFGSFTANNIQINAVNPPTPDPNVSSQWTHQTSVHVPSANVWFPAISSGFGPNSFVMTNGDANIDLAGGEFIENELVSSVFDASDYINLTLELDMYFSRYNATIPEYVNIEISTDGGITWPNVIDNITTDVGYGTDFNLLSYDLSAYAGMPNLRMRVHYFGEWGDGVAVDNIKLYGNNTINPLATWTQPPGVQIYTDPAGTIPYTGDSRNVIYVVPSPAELQSSETWSFTASVTLANGCTASGGVDLQNRTKYFMGSTNDWNDPSNWSPAGVPTSNNCVIIPDTYSANIVGTVDGDAYNLHVQNGGNLDIQTDGTLTVQNYVNVDASGQFTLENSASLIQVQDQTHPDYVANTGDIDLNRNTFIRDTDWVYWSSPVANYAVSNISPTTSSNYIGEWLPTVAANTNGFGIWNVISEDMIAGKGYIVKGPNTFNSTPQNYTATFTGTPHNGNISLPISRGNYNGADYVGPSSTMVTRNDDNLNLVGNPYPSSLNAIDFLTANSDIEGSIRLWTHGTEISSANADPFFADEQLSYSINDYLIYNSTGSSSGPGTFNGYVGAGQSFFVIMEHTSPTPSTVNFDNTMRDRTYTNADFFRTSNTNDEQNRIWLSIRTPNNQLNKTLVGYVQGATLAKDRMYDAVIFDSQEFGIYSIIEDDKLAIQGRPVPFNDTDIVPLGIQIKDDGIHTIAINAIDGLFEHGQDIYLEDLSLGVVHDLKNSPYTFNTTAGLHEDRFVLRFTNPALNIDDFNMENELSIYSNNQNISILSTSNQIQAVTIYDLLGRVITTNAKVNSFNFAFDMKNQSNGTYIVKVKLENGSITTKKIIN